MSRPKWTRTGIGYAMTAGSASVTLWRTDDGWWRWAVLAGHPTMYRIHTETEKPTRRAQTAARHALAWVRKHMTPIVGVAWGDEPEMKP